MDKTDLDHISTLVANSHLEEAFILLENIKNVDLLSLDDQSWYYTIYSRFATKKGDFELGKKYALQAIECNPSSPLNLLRSYLNLGNIHLRLDEPYSALECYQKMEQLLKEPSLDKKIVVTYTCIIHASLAQAYDNLGQYEYALHHYELAFSSCEQDTSSASKSNLAGIYRNTGHAHYRLNHLQVAEIFFRYSLEQYDNLGSNSEKGIILEDLSKIYLFKGDVKTAQTLLGQAIELHIQDANKTHLIEDYVIASLIFQTTEDFTQSLEYLDKANTLSLEWKSLPPVLEANILENYITLYCNLDKLTAAKQKWEELSCLHQKFNHPMIDIIYNYTYGILLQAEGKKNTAYILLKSILPKAEKLHIEEAIKLQIRLIQLLLEQTTSSEYYINQWHEIPEFIEYVDRLITSVKQYYYWTILDQLLYLRGRLEIIQMNFEKGLSFFKESLNITNKDTNNIFYNQLQEEISMLERLIASKNSQEISDLTKVWFQQNLSLEKYFERIQYLINFST